jgi:hypothetical protein
VVVTPLRPLICDQPVSPGLPPVARDQGRPRLPDAQVPHHAPRRRRHQPGHHGAVLLHGVRPAAHRVGKLIRRLSIDELPQLRSHQGKAKLVRCTRGAILDIIVDVRPESPTYLTHVAVELNADNHRGLYVPGRFAHGYQVLEDITETSYQVGEFYAPGHERGLRYDDPGLGLSWPLPVVRSRRRIAPGCCPRSSPR